MENLSNQFNEKKLTLKESKRQSKVISLEKAIADNINTGMKIHIGGFPNAAITEIIRQFWDKRPEFTLIVGQLIGFAIDMIHAGLVRKVIGASCYERGLTERPSAIVQRAYKEREIEVENWSLLSIIMRLIAGAMGTGFMPTRSIMGSSMSVENNGSFMEIDDPFGGGDRIGLVRALRPDISLIHGLAADSSGNTILAPNLFSDGIDQWGALASKGGVIVTVEKVVSTEFIQKHSSLVKVPGYMVNAVSEVPFGAHPEGLDNFGLEEISAYGPDYDFMMAHKEASENLNLNPWIREWMLDCASRQEYFHKLGYEKITFLKSKMDCDNLKYTPALGGQGSQGNSITEALNPAKRMVIVAARKAKERVYIHDHKIILAGPGFAALTAWLAYCQLREEGYDIALIQGTGLLGYLPHYGNLSTVNPAFIRTSKMISDILFTYGVIVGGENNRCLSILGAGQIDRYGNINNTRTAEGDYLVGSGGGNDAVNAKEVLVVAPQSKRRFVDKVPYTTCPGDRVTTLISTEGVFEKPLDKNEFILTAYYPNQKLTDTEQKIKAIREKCGWELEVSSTAKEIALFTREELWLLTQFDPEGIYIGN
jgi:acyl CoA:acetate/3-ketoacid CoA transferase alpha subunit/acyl CoA:acetate/3-ketoacid CoA transferase beta subunit